MWLCSQLGFFSIVRKEADTFHIRARCLEDLDPLAKAAGAGSPVASFKGSDYSGASFAMQMNCPLSCRRSRPASNTAISKAPSAPVRNNTQNWPVTTTSTTA
jgi:hypothetical protein